MKSALEASEEVGVDRQSFEGPPKYLFFCPWQVKAGTGVNNVILGLRDAMRDRYNSVVVVTGWQEPAAADDHLWVKLRAPLLPVRNLLGFLFHLLPTMARLASVVDGAIAINPHFIGAELLPLVLLRKLRLAPTLILSVHGADVTQAAAAQGWEKKLLAWMFANADSVVACSDALASQVKEISPRAKLAAIWNGVSLPPERPTIRPLASPYLVSVAAFVKKKAHETLLCAFKQVSAEIPELKLVLIGADGPERSRIVELIAELHLEDKIHILLALPQEQVWQWLEHAECFVHAAREEPFGLALLEAALMSTPVVTTAVGGIKEYLVSEVHGLTCESDNPGQLAAAMLCTLGDPASASKRAQAFYCRAASFTWDAAWQQYASLSGLDESLVKRPAESKMRSEPFHSPR